MEAKTTTLTQGRRKPVLRDVVLPPVAEGGGASRPATTGSQDRLAWGDCRLILFNHQITKVGSQGTSEGASRDTCAVIGRQGRWFKPGKSEVRLSCNGFMSCEAALSRIFAPPPGSRNYHQSQCHRN
jgi:hypothetical protein